MEQNLHRVGYKIKVAPEQGTYPIVRSPKQGTIVYPFRRKPLMAGSLENNFAKQLQAWLPRQVWPLLDVCINVSEQHPPYRPDIALLIEGHQDIRIDVEIDEPYTAVTNTPIHYISCGDAYRDRLLNRHGWLVVRFTDSQVAEAPQSCAAYLMALLQAIAPELTAAYALNARLLQPVKQWTKNDALKMAAQGTHRAEERRIAPELFIFNEEERQYQQWVEPLPRTVEMQTKMDGFKDAGRYAQDHYIDFEPQEHIYTYNGRKRLLPVSSLIAYFFEEFNALQAARRKQLYKGVPIEESLDLWDKIGRQASEVGTFVHEQTENYFQRGYFENECPFCYDGQTTQISVEREKEHFLHFVEDYKIVPYRQEWPVFDTDLNIAGTIDLICQEPDGEFTIYDWKRSAKVVDSMGVPIVEGFNGKTGFNGIHLPDTAFYHYCIQQNLYRYMLETHYGIKIKAMNLVVLCPDYPTYYVAPVPKMDEVIAQVVGACKQKNLGHQLLYHFY